MNAESLMQKVRWEEGAIKRSDILKEFQNKPDSSSEEPDESNANLPDEPEPTPPIDHEESKFSNETASSGQLR